MDHVVTLPPPRGNHPLSLIRLNALVVEGPLQGFSGSGGSRMFSVARMRAVVLRRDRVSSSVRGSNCPGRLGQAYGPCGEPERLQPKVFLGDLAPGGEVEAICAS